MEARKERLRSLLMSYVDAAVRPELTTYTSAHRNKARGIAVMSSLKG